MSFDAERLYALLPALYRLRDHAHGEPLRALLEVVADQAAVLEESLEQLYDDQFVETAAPWVLPYLGDLLGIEGLPGAALAPRAEVANTLSYRRRKGTAHVLERIARDTTGLPARAVEFFQLLAATQHLNHLRPENRAWISLRGAARLEQLGGPFERLEAELDLAHTADVRRIPPGRGRYNIPNLGVFLWRLRAYRLHGSPAVPAAAAAGDPGADPDRCFRFSPLGCDAPLFNLPVTEEDPATLAAPANVPGAISRRAMHARPAEHYGAGRSLLVERRVAGAWTPLGVGQVRVCDLSGWKQPPAGMVAVDPVLGRLAFGEDQEAPPRVTFHYGFSADLGGGEYDRRSPAPPAGERVVRVRAEGGADATTLAGALALLDGRGGTVEIADGGRYAETLGPLDLHGRRVTLRAADGRRPTLVLGAALHVAGGDGDALTLDGLLVMGGRVVVDAPPAGAGGLGRLVVRHSTLVPGLALDVDGEPVAPGAPSLVVASPGTQVLLERSITGPVRAVLDAVVAVQGSVVDATTPAGIAFADPAGTGFGAVLRVEESTLFGRVMADALELVSDSILLAEVPAAADPAAWPGPVLARRTQEGCVRFSYLPPRSRTPRRFRCVPARDSDDARVRPWPASTRYGAPAYAQLPPSTPDAVRRGAGDEGEMGVLHPLLLPLREAHLRTRLDEYLRFGQEAGVFFAT
jgi:hypothetical protein